MDQRLQFITDHLPRLPGVTAVKESRCSILTWSTTVRRSGARLTLRLQLETNGDLELITFRPYVLGALSRRLVRHARHSRILLAGRSHRCPLSQCVKRATGV